MMSAFSAAVMVMGFPGESEAAMPAPCWTAVPGGFRRVDLRTPVKPTGAVLSRRLAPCATRRPVHYSPSAPRQPLQAGVAAAPGRATRSTSAASPRPPARRPRPAPGPARASRTRRLAKASESSSPVDAEEGVHAARRRRRPARPGSAARPSTSSGRGRARSRATSAGTKSCRPSASAASAPRCTNTGAQELLNSSSLPTASRWPARQHQPAQPPARHQEALGEAVHDDQAVVGAAMSRKLGARRRRARSPNQTRS